MNTFKILPLSLLLLTSSAFAQGGSHVGGGNITEADLQSYMNKIDTYLLSEEGLTAFPEIVQYNSSHPNQSFHELVQSIRPVVKNTDLKDSFGEVRDCLSYPNPGNRYFVCNSTALPEKTLDNQPSFYRIVFHELLIQAGLEKPISREIPSAYPISARITDNVHLETYQEWVPGKSANHSKPLSDSLMCEAKISVDEQPNKLKVTTAFLRPSDQPNYFIAKIENYVFYAITDERFNARFSPTLQTIQLIIEEHPSADDSMVLNDASSAVPFFKTHEIDDDDPVKNARLPAHASMVFTSFKNNIRTFYRITCFQTPPEPWVWEANKHRY